MPLRMKISVPVRMTPITNVSQAPKAWSTCGSNMTSAAPTMEP